MGNGERGTGNGNGTREHGRLPLAVLLFPFPVSRSPFPAVPCV
jgi:hypothetical protein